MENYFQAQPEPTPSTQLEPAVPVIPGPLIINESAIVNITVRLSLASVKMGGQEVGEEEGEKERLTEVMTMGNNMTNFGLYSGPTFNPAISARHLSVTFLKSGASRNCRTVNTVPLTAGMRISPKRQEPLSMHQDGLQTASVCVEPFVAGQMNYLKGCPSRRRSSTIPNRNINPYHGIEVSMGPQNTDSCRIPKKGEVGNIIVVVIWPSVLGFRRKISPYLNADPSARKKYDKIDKAIRLVRRNTDQGR
ncbi:uncharacterized protein F5147DRAFT_656628 [Suillus discolor]|uniref:Uncharacterized protein n=1 Tax=Suillus discolor TaxID=1912936 RepID=A0A9P7EXB5_9AGAM|nr:uncharacterized protein F5147DRAFT_656628 [Suillus discolor]KAG2096313.1 hypothetical protein F5147DRAFT_656628 [Suillus discolor]